MWYFRGISIDRVPSSGMWRALVNLPGYAGYLQADTKQGVRDLINHYRQEN